MGLPEDILTPRAAPCNQSDMQQIAKTEGIDRPYRHVPIISPLHREEPHT